MDADTGSGRELISCDRDPSATGLTLEGLRVGLNWVAIGGNVGRHIMKTTIEIADDLFVRAQRLAREEKTTFRALTEEGLRLVLKEKQARSEKLPPLVTVPGALTDDFKDARWEELRNEIYKGRGA
jgi:hypothetical protein